MANAFSNSPAPRAPKSGSDGGTKRRYTFSLSFAGLLTSGIIMIIAVGWIFAFGVIVGRGYNPEKKLPELAKLLPSPPGTEEIPPQPILKAEELTFMNDLKQRNPTTTPQTKPESPTTAQSAPQQQTKPPTATAPKTTPAPETKQQFNYVFQAAAFKKKEQASKLRKRMESEGLRTKLAIEKDQAGKPKWYRVQVLVRGADAEAADAKKIMTSLGLHDVQQASKTPVSTRRSR